MEDPISSVVVVVLFGLSSLTVFFLVGRVSCLLNCSLFLPKVTASDLRAFDTARHSAEKNKKGKHFTPDRFATLRLAKRQANAIKWD